MHILVIYPMCKNVKEVVKPSRIRILSDSALFCRFGFYPNQKLWIRIRCSPNFDNFLN